MADSQDPQGGEGDESGEMVTLRVRDRREQARLMRGFAAREGASLEELASLWLGEKLDEAMRSSRSTAAPPSDGGE